MKERKPNKARLMALLCIVLFFYGFYLGGIQLVLSEVSDCYGLQKTGMGALVSAQHVSAVIFPVLLGMLADRIGKKFVISLACAMFCVGCVLAGASTALAVYVMGALCIGVGYSVCESVGSAVLADLDPENSARTINLSQALLSAGAVISPLLLQYLRDTFGLSWRLPFAVCAAAYAVLTLVLLTACFPKSSGKQEKETGGKGLTFFTSGVFCCLFFGMIFYVGLENGISYFVESLFSEHLHREELGAGAISAYWFGMVASRLLSSATMKRPVRVLIGSFAASGLALLGIALSPNAYLSVAFCALAGFFYGPIWSTLVALAAREFPQSSAGATGLMSAGCGLGGILYPILMGFACDSFSMPAAFGLLAITAFAGMVLCMQVGRLQQKAG